MDQISNVSIVITCYNLEDFISQAIHSVILQIREDRKVEIIVVDDASTDKSLSIVKEFSDVNIIQMSANSGVLLATIAGMEACSSDIILFLDGDDIWSSNKLQLVIEAFDADPDVGFVTHDLEFIDLNGNKLNRKSRTGQVLSGSINAGCRVKKGILNHSDFVWLGSAYAIRRSKVDLEGFLHMAGSMPNPVETYQDWPLAYWCAAIKSVKCVYIDVKLMSYRVHGLNYSGDATTVAKAIRNLRKSYYTAASICEICRIKSVYGFPHWLSKGKRLYYAYMVSLYSNRKIKAFLRFVRLQMYLILSSNRFAKEWIRFLAIMAIGPERFTWLLNR